MSEPIQWQQLTPEQRTKLAFEHVTRTRIPESFTVTLATPWKLAEWFVDQHQGAFFEVRYDRETPTSGRVHASICLHQEDNHKKPVNRYHAHGKDVDDVLCVALLRATGVEVNDG